MADAGEDAVEEEHLPQIGGEAGGQPSEKDAQSGQGEEDAGAPAVQQDAQQGGGDGANQSGQGEDGGGVGGTASEVVFEGVEIDGFAVFGAALHGHIAQGEDENYPAVVEAGQGAGSPAAAGCGGRRGVHRAVRHWGIIHRRDGGGAGGGVIGGGPFRLVYRNMAGAFQSCLRLPACGSGR